MTRVVYQSVYPDEDCIKQLKSDLVVMQTIGDRIYSGGTGDLQVESQLLQWFSSVYFSPNAFYILTFVLHSFYIVFCQTMM